MNDHLSQRMLVYELKHAIDRCVRRPWDAMARRHLEDVVRGNPHGVRSRHVLYNIGRGRREWLAAASLRESPRGEKSLRRVCTTRAR